MKDSTYRLPFFYMGAALAIMLGCLFIVIQTAFAQMPLPSDADPFAQLVALITNVKALSPVAIAAAVISILVAGVNKFVPDLELKRLAVLGLSTIFGFIQLVANGKTWLEAGMLAIFTYGGAIALYETVKGIIAWAKKKAA